MKRFAIHPGHVRSASDGQYHYLTGGRLIELYGLDFRECFVVRNIPGQIVDPELMPLFPRDDGRYKESLLERKVEDFHQYIRAKKLLEYHTSGTSPRRGAMRRAAAERQAKSIAWHEKHWPDFPAAYAKYVKDHP